SLRIQMARKLGNIICGGLVYLREAVVWIENLNFSVFFFFSRRRRHTICYRDWSSDVCSSDLSCGSASCEQARPARLARGDGPWLERGAHPLRVGRQTSRTASARLRSSPRTGRLRRLHPSTHLSLPPRGHSSNHWPQSSHRAL